MPSFLIAAAISAYPSVAVASFFYALARYSRVLP
jgi:hypothetical protein